MSVRSIYNYKSSSHFFISLSSGTSNPWETGDWDQPFTNMPAFFHNQAIPLLRVEQNAPQNQVFQPDIFCSMHLSADNYTETCFVPWCWCLSALVHLTSHVVNWDVSSVTTSWSALQMDLRCLCISAHSIHAILILN